MHDELPRMPSPAHGCPQVTRSVSAGTTTHDELIGWRLRVSGRRGHHIRVGVAPVGHKTLLTVHGEVIIDCGQFALGKVEMRARAGFAQRQGGQMLTRTDGRQILFDLLLRRLGGDHRGTDRVHTKAQARGRTFLTQHFADPGQPEKTVTQPAHFLRDDQTTETSVLERAACSVRATGTQYLRSRPQRARLPVATRALFVARRQG